MERLTFLGVIVGSLLAAPLAAEAQQAGKVWRIGCLSPAADRNNPIEDAFYRSMQARARPCQGLPAIVAAIRAMAAPTLVLDGEARCSTAR